MRTRLAITLLLGLATSGQAMASPETAADIPTSPPLSPDHVLKSDTLGCVLTVEPISQMYRIPTITVALTNQTRSDIYLVGSLDGSDSKWRYPHCYFDVIGPDGKPVSGAWVLCPSVNPLEGRDFVRVPPGGTFDPYHGGAGYPFFAAHQISPYTFRVPGKYRIRFFYSTASEVMADWAWDGREGLTEKFSLVPKVEVSSNEVVVEVAPPSELR